MPANIDLHPRLRRQALLSAGCNALFILLSSGVLLWLRNAYWSTGGLSALLLILALLNAALLLPLGWSLRERFHEIQGGEENEARQY